MRLVAASALAPVVLRERSAQAPRGSRGHPTSPSCSERRKTVARDAPSRRPRLQITRRSEDSQICLYLQPMRIASQPEFNVVHDQLTGRSTALRSRFHLSSDPSAASSRSASTPAAKPHQHFRPPPKTHAPPRQSTRPPTRNGSILRARASVRTPGSSSPSRMACLVPAQYKKHAQLTSCTFHGQPVDAAPFQRIVSEQNASRGAVYSSEGALLEADLPEPEFLRIRDDFKLQNRPHTRRASSAPLPIRGSA